MTLPERCISYIDLPEELVHPNPERYNKGTAYWNNSGEVDLSGERDCRRIAQVRTLQLEEEIAFSELEILEEIDLGFGLKANVYPVRIHDFISERDDFRYEGVIYATSDEGHNRICNLSDKFNEIEDGHEDLFEKHHVYLWKNDTNRGDVQHFIEKDLRRKYWMSHSSAAIVSTAIWSLANNHVDDGPIFKGLTLASTAYFMYTLIYGGKNFVDRVAYDSETAFETCLAGFEDELKLDKKFIFLRQAFHLSKFKQGVNISMEGKSRNQVYSLLATILSYDSGTTSAISV